LKHSIPKKIVLIGASTGGPGQIQKIIDALPKLQNTSIVIAQHMIASFLKSFANNLSINNNVVIADGEEEFLNATIYICNGNIDLVLYNDKICFRSNKAVNSYNPNINMVFNSFVPLSQSSKILCAILTGIGDDGVEACKNLSEHNVECLTESEQSAIVDGMPNRVRELVPNVQVMDIQEIVTKIKEFCE